MSNQTELRQIESGIRSSLFASKEGRFYRLYHDTRRWEGPLILNTDDKGIGRLSRNRRASSLLQTAWGETEYRGEVIRNVPRHLEEALKRMCEEPDCIDTFASLCGVKSSTAWSYACKVVEGWPSSHSLARKLVFSPLLEACEEEAKRGGLKGSLKDAMRQIHPRLSDDVEWRCLSDPYSHLRLARICLVAADKKR